MSYTACNRLPPVVDTKEGQVTGRHSRLGVLLGMSLALLLSGGVAMAAASLSIEPWCRVCCDDIKYDQQAQYALPACDDFWTITTSGWGDSERVGFAVSSPGPRQPVGFRGSVDENGQRVIRLYLMCWRGDDAVQTLAGGGDWVVTMYGDWDEDYYGTWGVRVQGSEDAVQGEFYFAGDPGVCQAMEFVPEPGSVLLLGSGLAGLAGYATLRWRARE
jgi:hypothetical protein